MSKKPSITYFKSRMSSFLNPLFLCSIATLGLFGFVIWQFVLQPNQLARNDEATNTGTNPANNSAQGVEGGENSTNSSTQGTKGTENPNTASQNQDSVAKGQEEVIEQNFLSQTTTGKEIFDPISGTGQKQGQNKNTGGKLYEQIVNLDLFPELLPEQANGNDPLGLNPSGEVNVPPPGSGSGYTQYGRQYGQYQSGNSGPLPVGQTVPTAQTPLAAAVNQVMASSNYNRYVRQMPVQPATSPYAVPPQTGINNNQVMTNSYYNYNRTVPTAPYGVTPSPGMNNNQMRPNGYNSAAGNNGVLFPNAAVSGSAYRPSYQSPVNPNASFGY
jgi:hypothetical protein